METVLGSQHVEATRLFRVEMKDLTLRSVGTTNEIWFPGEVKESRCLHVNHHPEVKVQPAPQCTCGVWSCKSRNDLHRTFPPIFYLPESFLRIGQSRLEFVSARIEQWGVVIEHERGYRSEFARIIPETIQWYPRPKFHQNRKLLLHLREKYAASSQS